MSDFPFDIPQGIRNGDAADLQSITFPDGTTQTSAAGSTSGFVDETSIQTISGLKTFSNGVKFSDATIQTTAFKSYYLGVGLSGDDDTPTDAFVTIEFDDLFFTSAPYNANNNDFNTGTYEWTCPTDGLYMVQVDVCCYMTSDDLRGCDIEIYKNSTGVAGSRFNNNYGDDTEIVTLECTTLVDMIQNDTMHIEGRILRSGGSVRKFLANTVGGGRATSWIITRVA